MPDVTAYTDEKEWMAHCVPKMVDEGREQDQAVAACASMWQERGSKSLDLALADVLKFGARNNRKDAQRLQTIHDYAKDNGAVCAPEEKRWVTVNGRHIEVDDEDGGSSDSGSNDTPWDKYKPGDPERVRLMKETLAKLKKKEKRLKEARQSGLGRNFGGASRQDFHPGKSIDMQDISLEDLIALILEIENAIEAESSGKSVDVDSLITFGGAVKALDGGKVGGYLVRFGSASDPDLTGDFFTVQTDFGGAQHSDVYYQHGLDTKIGKRKIGDASITFDDVGAWAEAQLNMRDEYEKAIYQMAQAGKLGWSSGTAAHLVERAPDGKAQRITKWPLGLDASLTPTPAEPRNAVMSLKTYQPTTLDVSATPETAQENRNAEPIPTAGADSTIPTGEATMSDEPNEEFKALTDKVAALEAMIKSAPPVPTLPAAGVTVVVDEADKPFKSIAENCAAVKSFELSRGRTIHPRLTNPALKATGANESIPDQGGYLIDPTLTTEFLAPTHEPGQYSAMVRRLPVGSNSNYGWINGVDETDRATGSRWGGLRGYRLAEGDEKTKSKPKFRRINWELKKYAVLVYGTDELLADAAQFSVVVRQGVSEEIDFMLNDDILNGIGAGGPFGILQSPALVTVDKENLQAADTIITTNLSKMWQRLLPRSKANAAWFVNSDVMPQLDELTIPAGTAAVEPRFVTYNATGIMSIKGKPVYETEFNATVGDKGDIVLADMTQYLLWEKSGVQEAVSIHVQFVTDETVFRFVYRVDGQSALHSALTPYKGSATQSPFVTLAERS